MTVFFLPHSISLLNNQPGLFSSDPIFIMKYHHCCWLVVFMSITMNNQKLSAFSVTSKQQSTDSHLYGKPNENTNHLLMENGTEAHVYSSNESARDSEGGIRPSNDVTMVIPELTVSNQINSKHTELGEYELDSLHLNGNGEVSNQMDRSFEDSPSGLIDSNEEKLLFHESVASSCSIRTQNASNGFSESFTGDMSIEQPSLEYDETWKLHMYDVKSPDISSDEQSRKHKIVIKDLSFDDNSSISELTRIDLLCPVFLAVTEDEEDDDYVLKDIRRKTKSIENLFSTIDEEQGALFSLLFQAT